MDAPRLKSNAIRQYGKNIIEHFHSTYDLPRRAVKLDQEVLVPVRDGGKVGIIGGGVGGLYAAMLLQDRGIPFEILEASGRVGGRLFTHKFSEEEHDYFDVGAMRFPDTPLMHPVFVLFNHLGFKKGGKLIPYILENPNSTLFYNSVLKKRADATGTTIDFKPWDIPPKYARHRWTDLVDNVIDPFANALVDDVINGTNDGWKRMMEYDKYSTRAYMAGNRSDTDPALDKLRLMPYPLSVVNWCETFDTSSSAYDRALSEEVLDALAFAWPETNPTKGIEWFCVDGGSGDIASRMLDCLDLPINGKLMLNSRVISIGLVSDEVEVTLADGHKRRYDHVINTSTLPCLRTMDLTGARLDVMQKSCLRQLQYGPSTKIGIKFKTAWWENASLMPFGPIVGGQSFTDNMSRIVVYPSYGVNGGKKSTVLIASYAWTADALALTGLMGSDPASKEALKRRILQDLVAIHGLDPVKGKEFLEEQYVDSFAYSWTQNLNSIGAFGYFGPGEFSSLFPNLTRPAAEGRLHFAGEAVSARHGWVVGALEASQRAVKEVLISSYRLADGEMDGFEQKWGWLDEVDLKWGEEALLKQIALTLEHVFPEN